MTQDPERVAERLRDVVIEFGLLRLRATTDTHIITVQEPSIWDTDARNLRTDIREIDL